MHTPESPPVPDRARLAVFALLLALGACRSTQLDPPPTPAAPTLTVLASDDARLAPLAWLTGTWIGNEGERSYEEHWTPARGGTILGIHREVLDGETRFFEYLRIEVSPDGIQYVAQPLGSRPTSFRLESHDERSATFSSGREDWPQVLRYERIGPHGMRASASGTPGSGARTATWEFERGRVEPPPSALPASE